MARRVELFLETYHRPDGGKRGGADLERRGAPLLYCRPTQGQDSQSSYEKMRVIAKAMGFPPQLWLEEDLGEEGGLSAGPEGNSIPARLEHLFETIKDPKTGEPYTNAEVARMSAGDLSVEDVEGIRTGKITDPSVARVAALAAAFGVPPSYLLDRAKESSVLDEEVLAALADERASAILRESARLSEREKEIVLGIVRQFESQNDDA